MAKKSYEVISMEQMVYYYHVEAESEEEVQKMIDEHELPDEFHSDCVDWQTEINEVGTMRVRGSTAMS
jgi:hypothetical protein